MKFNFLIFTASGLVSAFLAQSAAAQDPNLREMSLEELMSVEVTSVSKRTELRSESPAAIYVITEEDIRRSTATNVMELLRMAPGVHVARLDANKWSITMRGTSGRFANKLLVLVDGRSIYTPLYSGVEWEARQVPLEEVARIEVVRGPGGTLWGANAVNGVINIVTKSAQESQGGQLVVRGGSEEATMILRYGEKLSETGAYKIYGKMSAYDEGAAPGKDWENDDWERYVLGFRTDWTLDEDSFTLQGDVHRSATSERSNKYSVSFPAMRQVRTGGGYWGGNLLGRWTRVLSEEEDFELQAYYEYATVGSYSIEESRHTFDLQFQHRFRPTERQELVWGMEYRLFREQLDGSFYADLQDGTSTHNLLSFFVQDEITLSDSFRLWLGTKLEYNEFTGVEVQPSLRAAWTPDERQTLWASVSRAVRTPSLIEDDGLLTLSTLPGVRVLLQGQPDFQSEELVAYEAGYRLQLTSQAAIDVAAYYHDYSQLRTLELDLPYVSLNAFPPHLVAPIHLKNNAAAEVYGIELGLDWKPLPQVRTRLAYTWSEFQVDVQAKTFDPITLRIDGDTPEQQVYLQAMWDIGKQWEIDATVRYVDRLPAFDVDAYVTGDLRIAWKPRENMEFSIVGQNLFQPDHPEFAPSFVNTLPTNVERGVYGQFKWQF